MGRSAGKQFGHGKQIRRGPGAGGAPHPGSGRFDRHNRCLLTGVASRPAPQGPDLPQLSDGRFSRPIILVARMMGPEYPAWVLTFPGGTLRRFDCLVCSPHAAAAAQAIEQYRAIGPPTTAHDVMRKVSQAIPPEIEAQHWQDVEARSHIVAPGPGHATWDLARGHGS